MRKKSATMVKAYVIAVAAVAGLAAGWTANGWRLNAKIDRMVSSHAIAVQVATQAAAEETARMQKEKDDAIAKANQAAQRNAAAAASATRERDRLRDDLAASRLALSDATHASLVEYTNSLSTIFEHCSREYADMAATADRHAADAELLFNAWKGISK
jgi:cysteinyl-tRNA synthetase